MSRSHLQAHQPEVREKPCKSRRGSGLFTVLFQAMVLYGVLVFAGGTLINTPNNVACEVGKLLHTVTFVEPLTDWARAQEMDGLAGGLQTLAAGFPVHQYVR